MSDNDLQREKDGATRQANRKSWLLGAWEYITQTGLAEFVLRLGTHALMLALILLFAWGLRGFYLLAQAEKPLSRVVSAATQPTPTAIPLPVPLPAFEPGFIGTRGIIRLAHLHTDVPALPRTDVLVYTVQSGDSVFGIAEKFNLKPETILWANQAALADNPHNLRPGQELNVLPVDGTYHRWSAGDGLNGVAKFFNVKPEDIIHYPGNHLTPESVGDWSNPNIEAGTWLIIPGGRREYVSWSAPNIPREDPSVAQVLGPGACNSEVEGAIGSGVFIWPANSHSLSGFGYEPSANHNGVDIDGNEGDPVYAADSGVVVYAGWNNWGYGNTVVINHGNSWQTLYAHLSAYYVSCGQSVFQGNTIGTVGSTGNASGSHLHFEMLFNGAKANPMDYLP